MVKLGLDQAVVNLINELDVPITAYSQLSVCNLCTFDGHGVIQPNENGSFVIDTKWSSFIKIISLNGTQLCDDEIYTTEKGNYLFNATDCKLTAIREGWPSFVPILGATLIFATFIILYDIITFCSWRRKCDQTARRLNENDIITTERTPLLGSSRDLFQDVQTSIESFTSVVKKRDVSLDVMRGIIIIAMIFVNYGGGGYSYFNHSPWYGLTVADIIFPAFIFMMGISIPLSIKSQIVARQEKYIAILCRILLRSSKLFLLGIVLNTWKSDIRQIRIPGVLQRFALSYLVVALLHLMKSVSYEHFRARRTERLRSVMTPSQKAMIYGPEFTVMLIMTSLYLYFTLWFHFDPNCPRGYQGPGGLEHNGTYFNCTGGAAGQIDRDVFGSSRIYQRSTSKSVYRNTLPFDPEGLLGLTNSILLTWIGVLAGRVMIKYEDNGCRRLWRLFQLLTVCVSTGYMLKSSGLIPIIKNLWSLSYILICGSISIGLLFVLYLVVDVWKLWPRGWPFEAPGKNSILLYVGHEVIKGYFPFYYQVDDTSHSLLLMRTCISTTIWLGLSLYLDYKKIYVTL